MNRSPFRRDWGNPLAALRAIEAEITAAEGTHQNAPPCTRTHRLAPNDAIVRNEPTATRPLSPRHLAAIDLLFAGASYSTVARQLNIDRSTLFRWRRTPAFADEILRRYRGARA